MRWRSSCSTVPAFPEDLSPLDLVHPSRGRNPAGNKPNAVDAPPYKPGPRGVLSTMLKPPKRTRQSPEAEHQSREARRLMGVLRSVWPGSLLTLRGVADHAHVSHPEIAVYQLRDALRDCRRVLLQALERELLWMAPPTRIHRIVRVLRAFAAVELAPEHRRIGEGALANTRPAPRSVSRLLGDIDRINAALGDRTTSQLLANSLEIRSTKADPRKGLSR